MNHEKYERRYAQICRALAANLILWARERKDEAKKAISSNNTELCRLYREELREAEELAAKLEEKK